MGWRYRKSVNLGGGFRINISKSGIGYSWGVPGYRHTYSANGTQRKTYSIPGTGISYVENVNHKNPNSNINYDENTKLITGNTQYFQNTVNISASSKDDDILKRIRQIRTIDILANILIFSILFMPLGILLKLAIICKYKIDLTYEMDEDNVNKYTHLNNFIYELSRNNKVWQVHSSTEVYNIKYNAGANCNITRNKVYISKKMPWYIRHNINVYCLNLKSEKIYFTPDRMLVFKKWGGVGCYQYNKLAIDFSTTNFVENSIVPRDSEISRYTWRYVNKNGGPDKRFNNNKQIPICKYGEITMKTNDGMNVLLEYSNHRLMPKIKGEFEMFLNYQHKANSTHKNYRQAKNENDNNLIMARKQLINTLRKVLIKKEQNISTTTHYYKSNIITDEFHQAYLLLNGNECDNPMDCYCKLVELWKKYRDTNIKFNQSMIDWIFDFCYLNNIECKIFEEEYIALPSQSVIKDIIIDYYLQGKPLHLPLSVLNSICVNSLTDNAFYRGGHNKQVQNIIPNVISFVDLELTRRYGYGIAQKYAPIYEETKIYYPFMHVNGKPIQSIPISAKNYTTNKQRSNIELSIYLNNLARFSENKLMELCGYRGRLKNVFLDDETMEIVSKFFNQKNNFFT